MKTIHILLITSVFAYNILGAAAPRAINYTPFFEATACGDRESIKNFLADKNVDINYRDVSSGMTGLYLASFFGDIESVELLLNNGANPDKGCYHPEDEDCFCLYAGEDDSEDTPLMLACEHENIALAELLLNRGAGVNKGKSGLYVTPLHIAAKSGNKELVKLLLVRGVKTNEKDCMGQTADKIAELNGHHDIAQWIRLCRLNNDSLLISRD
jgi:ankyrin repeat protein